MHCVARHPALFRTCMYARSAPPMSAAEKERFVAGRKLAGSTKWCTGENSGVIKGLHRSLL